MKYHYCYASLVNVGFISFVLSTYCFLYLYWIITHFVYYAYTQSLSYDNSWFYDEFYSAVFDFMSFFLQTIMRFVVTYTCLLYMADFIVLKIIYKYCPAWVKYAELSVRSQIIARRLFTWNLENGSYLGQFGMFHIFWKFYGKILDILFCDNVLLEVFSLHSNCNWVLLLN